MAGLTLQETQAISELASVLYSFLPGSTFAPTGVKIDFGTVAQTVGVGHLWLGGSKKPAIEALLEGVLQTSRDKFCPLMIRIVSEGLKYRNRKNNPVTQGEIKRINDLVAQLQFKIPELHDPKFIEKLPPDKSAEPTNKEKTKDQVVTVKDITRIKSQFMNISQLSPQEKGYAFENFCMIYLKITILTPDLHFGFKENK